MAFLFVLFLPVEAEEGERRASEGGGGGGSEEKGGQERRKETRGAETIRVMLIPIAERQTPWRPAGGPYRGPCRAEPGSEDMIGRVDRWR